MSKNHLFLLVTVLISFTSVSQKELNQLKQSKVPFKELIDFFEKDSSKSKIGIKEKLILRLPVFRKPTTILSVGYSLLAEGHNTSGNGLMNLALSHFEERNDELFHMMSVWNTKNGNYNLGIQYLDSAAHYSNEVYGYYGWVSLYYYRDYEHALKYLEKYDSLTPNFFDYPVGENILNLKGLAYMNLHQYEKAIEQFSMYIDYEKNKHGEDWVDATSPYYRAICYEKLNMPDLAMESYDLAIKIRPDFSEAIYHKAVLSNDLSEKKQLFELSLKLLKEHRELTDEYIELFEKVYIQEVEERISKLE